MSAQFRVLDLDVAADKSAWLSAWGGSADQEPFDHPTYLELFRGEGERALCALFEHTDADGGKTVITYPFFLRTLAPHRQPSDASTDVTTPYGYGGPSAFGSSPNSAEIWSEFWRVLDVEFVAMGVVSEFIRFNLFRSDPPLYPGDRITRMPNIVRDLRIDEAQLASQVAHKVRKNVRRARESGVEVRVMHGTSALDDFLQIYRGTMERRQAADSFFFSRAFFERLVNDLSDRAVFFTAYVDGAPISTELVLCSRSRMYSYLGGTHSSHFGLRPNDLLKYEIIKWGIAQRLDHFVIGGGLSAGDGIEKYKLSFAPNGSVDFVTGQRVVDPERYSALCVAAGVHDAPGTVGFFPAYRAPVPALEDGGD